MTEELGAISVGLRVGLGTLDRDLANIKKRIEPIEREHLIPFKVGNVNVNEIKREIEKISRGKVSITVTPTLSAGAGRVLHREIQNQLKAAGPVKVEIVADLSPTTVAKMRKDISAAVGKGGGTPVAVAPTAAPRSTPAGPSVASSPTATAARTAPAPRRTAREAHVATQAATQAAAPAPTPVAAPASPVANFGGLPTGPSTAVAYRTTAGGQTTVIRPNPRGVSRRIAKSVERQQSGTVSPDTLRAEKRHTQQPETPEEIEYASRPARIGLPLDEQAEFEQEKRGRGVRGARRSGARERNEPVLTAAERQAIGDKQDVMDEEAAAAADERIRKPGRRSRAYFGGASKNPTVRRLVSGLQFYRFDPVLGDAFAALQDGELGEARALLRGFSSKLAGADPRRRRRFFKLFRNTENVPPELLEQHAALQGLFSEIGQQEAKLRYDNADAALKAFPKPKGPQAGWSEEVLDKYRDLLGARQQAQRYMFDVLRGLRPRAGGGPVAGGNLMQRLAEAKRRKELYLVGENKPELFEGHSGRMEIVGEDGPEIRSFDEPGKIHPHVPEWVRRGMAKDLTGRAPGGPVRGYGGRAFRSFVSGEKEAIASGLLTRGDSASVQRVFVVNWPAGGAGFVSAPAGASRAAGPLRFATDREADAFARSIGKELKDLLGATSELKAKEPAAETVRPGPVTPEERVSAKLSAIFGEDPSALRSRLVGIRSATSETQQYAPVRSLAPAVGQQVATLFGRGELLRRLAVARDLTSQATRAEGVYNAEVEKTIKIQKQLDAAEDPETRKQLTEELGKQEQATKRAREETLKLTDAADAAAKHADAFSLKLGTLVGNTVGIIGGTLLFGATLGIAQAGLGAVASVLSPVIERMSSFQSTSAQVSATLADQVREQGGAVKTAVALTEAQAGLSKATADTISPLIEQRAQVEAGNKALTDSLAILHTFENTRARGGAAGLTGTTGGLFGTILGGVPSTSEQIGNELAGVPKAALPGGGISNTQRRMQEILQRAGVTSPDQLRGRDATAFGRLSQIEKFQQQQAPIDQAELEKSRIRLQFFNDAIEKGGEAFRFMAQQDLPNLTNAQRDAAAAAADAAGAFDIAANIRDRRTILTDRGGAPVTNAAQVTKALSAINTGLTTPDVDLLVKQLTERIIPAQRDLFAAQARFQRNAIAPAQFALQEAAAPTPGLTGGPAFNAGLVGVSRTGGIDKAAAAAAKSYETQVGGAVSDVNAMIAEGHTQLINLVPANLRTEFQGLLGDITATGKQISSIQLGIQQQQTNLQVEEYNNQLRIARRSLQDAKDLQAGISGETRNTLGGLEGQNIALQRQLQLLSFELQQRQINFRLATAGFVAPGTTPEERAARIEEAKKEAEFAQKQLDIQKQLANNQFKGIQISASRDVTDLIAQINLLEQGKQVTINVNAASRALDILNKKQALLVERAGTYIEEGVKITQAALDATSQIQQQTGKGFAYILGKTAEAWGIFGDQARTILQSLQGTAPKNYNPKEHYGGYASGIVGDTLGPTQITVGEAAGEKVAVLKNPKIVPTSSLGIGYGGSGWGGGGGGAPLIQMTVVIQGNTVREDTDLEQLAERVAAKTEQRLMTKTSLFGLRRA